MRESRPGKITIGSENAEFQIIRALKLNRVKRARSGEVFIEGIECIKQALKERLEITRVISADIEKLSDWGKGLVQNNPGAKIIEMAPALFAGLCDKTTPSELLVTAKVKKTLLAEITEPSPFVIVFDRPGDYGNFGSLIRSANAFRADAILVIGHGIDIYEPKVIRASLGGIFSARIIALDSLDELREFVSRRKSRDSMIVIGTDSTGESSLADTKIKRPVMVIIGNEAKGMSVNLKEMCDKIIRIPMGGKVNSLNVACAASIVMWEVYKNGNGEE